MARTFETKYPGTARFSTCQRYRWELTRNLVGLRANGDLPISVSSSRSHTRPLVSIGLNPSTATAIDDDPTIFKEIKFALRWGLSSYVKTNAYGWRETKPKIMFVAKKLGEDIVGAGNDDAIRTAIAFAQANDGIVFGAWGANIEMDRQAALAKIFDEMKAEVWCIKQNDDGSAKHPLYCRDDSKLIRWNRAT
jgi:hypothetical protein